MNSGKEPKIALFALLTMLLLSASVVAVDGRLPKVSSGPDGVRVNDVPVIPAVRVSAEILADRFSRSLQRADSFISSAREPEDRARTVARTETIALPRACTELSQYESDRLEAGFALMRQSAEGERLYRLLIDYDVCFDVEALPYNWGAFQTDGYRRPGSSRILVDDELISDEMLPHLASTLVHEAAHFERFQAGESCRVLDECETLSNGILVEEEMYATQVEARWLIDVYGREGARIRFVGWPGIVGKLDAVEGGDDALRAYIIETRSDPREGEGIGATTDRLAA